MRVLPDAVKKWRVGSENNVYKETYIEFEPHCLCQYQIQQYLATNSQAEEGVTTLTVRITQTRSLAVLWNVQPCAHFSDVHVWDTNIRCMIIRFKIGIL